MGVWYSRSQTSVKAQTIESFDNLLKVPNNLSSWKVAMHKVRYHSRRLVPNKGEFMTSPWEELKNVESPLAWKLGPTKQSSNSQEFWVRIYRKGPSACCSHLTWIHQGTILTLKAGKNSRIVDKTYVMQINQQHGCNDLIIKSVNLLRLIRANLVFGVDSLCDFLLQYTRALEPTLVKMVHLPAP